MVGFKLLKAVPSYMFPLCSWRLGKPSKRV